MRLIHSLVLLFALLLTPAYAEIFVINGGSGSPSSASVGDPVTDYQTGTGLKIVQASDTGRFYINTTGSDIVITDDTDAGLLADGLILFPEESGGNFLGKVTNFSALSGLTPKLLDWAEVEQDELLGTPPAQIEADKGKWYWDGAAWQILSLQRDNTSLDGSIVVNGDDLSLNYCAVNEFIHNVAPYHLTISHEGAGGTAKTVRINGVGATFGNLNKASDSGNGVVSFTGGVNGTLDRLASTIETITQVGEYIEYVNGNTGQFDTQYIQIAKDPTSLAHNSGLEQLRFRFNSTSWTLFDGAVQIGTGVSENATYRFTKTAYGWKITRGAATIFESPEVCNIYGENEISPDVNNILEERANGLYASSTINEVDGETGFYRLSEHKPLATINTTTAGVGTNIITGHDFTQATDMTLKLFVRDQAGDRGWGIEEHDVDNMLEQFNAGNTIDAYQNTFSNGYMIINIVDPATGEINIRDVTRDMEYVKSQLWVTAKQSPSPRIGEFVYKKSSIFTSDADALNKGYLAIKPGTIVNGANDYPLWAAAYTEFVVGSDIVFPADVDGLFLRNIGGDAGLEGDFQNSQNLAHTHNATRYASIPNNSTVGGNNGRWRGTTTVQTGSSGGTEARPVNRAYQLYTIIDSYLEAVALPAAGTTGISSDADNDLTLGSDNLPYYKAPETEFCPAVAPNLSNPGGTLTHDYGSFVAWSTDVEVEYSATSVTPLTVSAASGSGFIRIGTTVGGADILNMGQTYPPRLGGSPALLTNTVTVTGLTIGDTYYVTGLAGGTTTLVEGLEVCITSPGIAVHDPVTLGATNDGSLSKDANQELTLTEATLTEIQLASPDRNLNAENFGLISNLGSPEQAAFGVGAGTGNTANRQIAIGTNTGGNNTGNAQTSIGFNAGTDNTGDEQFAGGTGSGVLNTGDIQLAIGKTAGRENTGGNQVALGNQAGRKNTADDAVQIGANAGRDSAGDRQISIGLDAGRDNTGADVVFVGAKAGTDNTFNDVVIIGSDQTNQILATQDGEIVLGNPMTATRLTSLNYKFNVDQVLAAGLDGSVLTYNATSGEIELKANPANTLNAIGTAGATQAIDFTQGLNASFDLTAPTTLTFTDPNIAAGMVYVRISQDATGGHAITWPANVLGDTAAIDITANANTVVPLYFDGTNYHL